MIVRTILATSALAASAWLGVSHGPTSGQAPAPTKPQTTVEMRHEPDAPASATTADAGAKGGTNLSLIVEGRATLG
jgi:hypothetical protein